MPGVPNSFARKMAFTTLVWGILTIAFTFYMGSHFPQSANLAEGYKTPIIAFEFAQTPEDLEFLTGPSEQAAAKRAQMINGHKLDMVYPLFYAGMLALGMVALARSGDKLAWLGLLMAALTLPTDIYENIVLNQIVTALERGESVTSHLITLNAATWYKWWAIAAAEAMLAYCLFKENRWVGGALAALSAATITAIKISGTNPTIAELAGPSIGLVLLYLILNAAWALRK